jgi:hypothetical protein
LSPTGQITDDISPYFYGSLTIRPPLFELSSASMSDPTRNAITVYAYAAFTVTDGVAEGDQISFMD